MKRKHKKVYVIAGGIQYLQEQKRRANNEGYDEPDIICYKVDIDEKSAYDIMINEYGYSGVCNLTELYNTSLTSIRKDIVDEIGEKFELIIY